MLPYWIAFLIAATGALTERSRLPTVGVPRQRPRGLNGTWWLVAVGLALFIGLRHEVGGDWGNYLNNFEALDLASLLQDPFSTQFLARDPGYRLFEWLAKQAGGGIYIVNLLSASVFSFGLARFCRALPHPWLALSLAIPYLVIVVAMGYTRQAVAIGCAMLALTWLQEGRRLRYLLWIAIASLFHQTALVLAPLGFLATSRHWVTGMLASALALAILLLTAAADSVTRLTSSYLESDYQSEGALIRLLMLAFPAALYFFRRHYFSLSSGSKRLWSWLALGALILFCAYFFSPSSTALDRIGLYLIPMQLAVFSHLPQAYSKLCNTKITVLLSLCYAGLTLFVWLFFGHHALYWLPYQSLLAVSL